MITNHSEAYNWWIGSIRERKRERKADREPQVKASSTHYYLFRKMLDIRLKESSESCVKFFFSFDRSRVVSSARNIIRKLPYSRMFVDAKRLGSLNWASWSRISLLLTNINSLQSGFRSFTDMIPVLPCHILLDSGMDSGCKTWPIWSCHTSVSFI